MEVVRSNLAHKIHRGDESMIAAEYKFGNTKVLVDTTYVCKTDEEREKVEREIAMAVWAIVDEIVERGEAV